MNQKWPRLRAVPRRVRAAGITAITPGERFGHMTSAAVVAVLGLSLVLPRTPAVAGHQCEGHYPAGTRCAKSSVSIEYLRSKGRLVGDVDSHMRWCVRNRTIVLRKVREGPNRTISTTKTGKRGWWTFRDIEPRRGRFYVAARYKERTYGIDGRDICYRAKTRKIRLR